MKRRTAGMGTSNMPIPHTSSTTGESGEELVETQRKTEYERGYMEKLDPNVTPESV
jgi:hypothetical protein